MSKKKNGNDENYFIERKSFRDNYLRRVTYERAREGKKLLFTNSCTFTVFFEYKKYIINMNCTVGTSIKYQTYYLLSKKKKNKVKLLTIYVSHAGYNPSPP